MPTFHEGITRSDGEGTTIERSGMPEEPRPTRHHVGADHAVTEGEALEMGRALFDAIAGERARDTQRSDET